MFKGIKFYDLFNFILFKFKILNENVKIKGIFMKI